MNKVNKRYEQLDKVFDFLEQNRLFSGTVLLSEGGNSFYKRAIGKRSFQEKQSVDSIFEIASISKSFTATAIMLLADNGSIRIDDPIKKFFPQLPYRGISIENLLNHTSGLKDYMEWFENEENWNHHKIVNNQDVVNFLETIQPKELFTVNKKWEYCNTGYVLLAETIRLVSNKEYGEFLNENIFTPLNMVNTSTYSQFLDGNLKRFALGFMYDRKKDMNFLPNEIDSHKYVYFLDGVKGDGGIKSTVEDLFKWEKSFYTNKILSKKSVDYMLKPARIKNKTTGYCPGLHKEYGGYGFGWALEEHSHYKKIVFHDGYWAGYGTGLISYRDYHKSIILLGNLDFTKEELNKTSHILALTLEKIFFHEEVNLEPFEQLIQ
ncbi:serine hydrolase domain-containing protein [Bacillus carboniphilus]|uniref:Serine hydrolase domain-containing protein n=1 Tax=Bacillus carboniphilus TaxID=86663 RepID=A0ABY9JS87_9BACI|nr:serine hydrolase domain-containing protein [Bacillus carboniphilus]WLR42207.1 serine hydrolase domain-containing protein [Bacillus carboniphilus]